MAFWQKSFRLLQFSAPTHCEPAAVAAASKMVVMVVQVCLWQQVMILDCLAGNEWRESSACAVWASRLQQSVWKVCGTITKLNFHPMHLRSILRFQSLFSFRQKQPGITDDDQSRGMHWITWKWMTLGQHYPVQRNLEVDDLEGSMTRFFDQGMTRLDDYPLPQTTWQGWMTWRYNFGGWMRVGVFGRNRKQQAASMQHPRSNSGFKS